MFWIIIVFVFNILATYSENLNGKLKLYDMFQSLDDDFFEETPANVVVKDLSVDLEQLDLMNITNKLNSMRKYLNTTHFQETIIKEFETRRIGKQGSWYDKRDAKEYLERTKALDLMMQLIYMARHKIRQLENEPYYNSKDTSYRIAFLYRRIRRIWKRLYDLYITMVINESGKSSYTSQKRPKFLQVNSLLNLHYKAAKLHVDFMYFWWVLVKMHEKYHFRHNIPNTFPPN